MRFTLHEHKAKRAGLHYDLRLEAEGGQVRSFAMRYQPPTEPGIKRMAIEQPLHEQESLDFEGTIEEGYGAGELKKIDSGDYRAAKETSKELAFQFNGSILSGSYVMLNTSGDKWLIFKRKSS